MRWQNTVRILLVAVLLGAATPAVVHAGAMDELIDAAGGSMPDVPDVPDPTPVDDGSSSSSSYDDTSSSSNSGYDNSGYDNSSSYSNSGSSDSSGYDSSSSYSSGSSSSDSGYSSDNSNSGGSSFWNLFKPVDPAYEEQQREKRRQQRAERQKRREDAARKRRDARKDREYRRQQEKERKKAESAGQQSVFAAPAPQPRGLPPSLKPPTADVPVGSEAKALSENQFRMATLLKKGSLTVQEQELLRQLHDVCRALWGKAVQNESLTAVERSRIKLSIPSIDFSGPEVAGQLADQLKDIRAKLTGENSPNVDLIKKFNGEKFQQLAEQASGELAENIVEGGQESFDNYLGAAKVTAAIRQGDVPAAGKEALDFLVGKLSSPQASMAVEGGRMYASTAFAALDNFMVKAMGATGNDFNTRNFWEKVKSEMTTGQKTVLEFVGGHDGK